MIEARQLSKMYQGRTVLDGASLVVPAGRCIMLMGGNGSGKTTLLHLLVGLRRADSGQVIWQGQDITRASRRVWQRARESWGFLPQHPALPPTATVAELVKFNARLRGSDIAPAYEWLERVGLQDTHHMRIDMLSGGMRQRLGIVLVLFFKPALIVLDEPASSLDPHWRRELATWIGEQTERGAAALVTSQLREPWPNTDYRRCHAGRVIKDEISDDADPNGNPTMNWEGEAA